jgi:cyclophilin family peptidyl-prolyl cis-trans isomerase
MTFISPMRFLLNFFGVFYGLALFAQAIPATPTQCKAAGVGNSAGSGPASVAIQWKDNSTGETQWIIRYSSDNGANYTILPAIASTTKTSTPTVTYVWTGALTNRTYLFKIQAYDGTYGNMSIPSAAITTSPMSLVATPNPCEAVNLNWQPVDNATTYKIYYRVGGTTTDLLLSTEDFFVTSYQVPSELTKSGITYQFVIEPFIGNIKIGTSNRLIYSVDGMTSKRGISGAPGAAFVHSFTHVTSSTVQTRLLTGVPAGLSFNSSTGNLTGNFPALGIYTLNYTIIFTSGCNLTQVFTIRVRPAGGAPVVTNSIPNWVATVGSTRNTPLDGVFRDPDADSAVRMTTTAGVMNVLLYDNSTPATVTNFMNYANAGLYNDVAFHRSVTTPVSLLETGGYRGVGTSTATATQFNRVVADSPVANEYGISNIKGTLAMVTTGEDPNSATSAFAINMGDNRATLDYANGGSTVFGRLTTPTLAVATTIQTYKKNTYNLLLDGSTTTTQFLNFPLASSTVLKTMDQSKLIKITAIAPIPTLSYAVTGNTNPAVASASIVAGELRLVSLTRGTTTITVTATDLDNVTKTHAFMVLPADTYDSWAATQTFPGGQNGTNQDPDADGWVNLQEFGFLGNPGLNNSTSQVVFSGSTGTTPSTRFLTVTFPVRKQTQGLSYSVEASMGLVGTWTELWKSSDGFTGQLVVNAVDQSDRTVVTIKDSLAFSAQQNRFLRVTVKAD